MILYLFIILLLNGILLKIKIVDNRLDTTLNIFTGLVNTKNCTRYCFTIKIIKL